MAPNSRNDLIVLQICDYLSMIHDFMNMFLKLSLLQFFIIINF